MRMNALKIICVIVMIAFLFPFFTISCQNQEIGTLTGLNLIMGAEVHQQRIDSIPLVTITFIMAAAAFILSFFKSKLALLAPVCSGVLGTIFLLMVKSQVEKEIVKQQFDAFQVEFKFGFYLALAGLIASAALGAHLIKHEKNVEKNTPPLATNQNENIDIS